MSGFALEVDEGFEREGCPNMDRDVREGREDEEEDEEDGNEGRGNDEEAEEDPVFMLS